MRKAKYYLLFLIVIITLYFYKTNDPYTEGFIAENIVFWSEDVKVSIADYTGNVRDNESNIYFYHGLFLVGESQKKSKIEAIFQKNKSWIIDNQSESLEFNLELSRVRFDYVESLARKFNASVDSLRYASTIRFEHVTDSLGEHYLVKLNEYDEYVNSNVEYGDYLSLRILHEVNVLRLSDPNRDVDIQKTYEKLKPYFTIEQLKL